MESPNISVRIRRHETLPCIPKHENLPRIRRHESVPCHGLHGTRIHSSAKALNEQRNNRAYATASVLIGRRLGSTKNNPYVGSFRHSPPTSLRSMAASSLPPLSSRKEAASKSSFLFSPSFAFAANSPYVGWFRHAPPVISSYNFLGTSASEMKNQKHKSGKRQGARKPPRKSSVVQHKIKRDSLLELDRWHHQLTSLLLGVDNEDTDKRPPLLLREIINGRLLGGSGEDDKQLGDRSIIQRCNNIYRPNTPLALSDSSGTRLPGYKNTVISRLTSWLLFPLVYADDECYDDDYRSINGDYRGKKTTGGLKYLLSAPTDERSIEIDSDENDDDDDYSSASSVDYDPVGESSISPETEREFSAEANLSISEISEAYYAHQLLDERRRRSNSDTTTTSQQSGLSPSSLNHAREEDNRQRLDYEITQMDIARMTRNASRHLDVDSILNLPTIVYRKRSSSSPRSQNTEQSFHHVCTPIREDRSSDSDSHGSSLILQGEETIHSEDGWSFMMVSGTKPPTVRSTKERRCKIIGMGNEDDHKAAATGGADDMCVICLEPFKDGDRLRVLPCNHSFHVGCIDRWLSGSHSHNECFTAGCPTCKKRPTSQSSSMQMSTLEVVETEEENGMSGSLPSWAFANLGSVMAMSTGDFLDDN